MRKLILVPLFIVCSLLFGCGLEPSDRIEHLYVEDLDVSNNVTIGGNISISGDVSYSGNLSVSDNISAGGDIIATGDVYGYDGIFDYLHINNNATIVGNITANSITADIEGYSIDVVQTYINGVTENDTAALVFGFEPSKIVISYSAVCHHDNYPYEMGYSTGHSIIDVIGIDTITIETNYTAVCDYNGTMDSAILHSNTNVLMAAGGYDGSTYARCWGIGTWTTATHTLLIEFDDVQNTRNSWTFFELTATAYR